jgi:integrating conjugative element protein (TIGR03765 family)
MKRGWWVGLSLIWQVAVATDSVETVAVNEPDLAQINELMTSYPITSDALHLQPQDRAMPVGGLPMPIFLVDDSETSIAWVKTNREHLIQAQALGWVVQASHAAQVASLQALLPDDTPWVVASADELATWLGVTRYPVLLLPATG